MDGIFHNAQEVYTRNEARGLDWFWIATFATKDLAEAYVTFAEISSGADGQTYEVRPV